MRSPIELLTQTGKISLYLSVFLIPLFFLPFAQDVLGFPKQILLLFLVFLSLFSWLGKQLAQGKIILRKSKMLYFALLLLFVFFSMATLFSLSKNASFGGWSLSAADNFLTFFSFLLMAFLFINILQTEKEVFFAIFLLLASGAIAALFLLLQIYGIFILPFDFSQFSSFSTIGDPYEAAIFLAALMPLSLFLALRAKKLIFWLLLFIFSASLILIDVNQAWIVLLLGLLTLIIFGLTSSQGKIRGNLAAFSLPLLVLSIFFIFFPLRFLLFPDLPFRVSPGIITQTEILKGVYTQGLKSIFLGTGPGTFIFDYSKYHSPILNQTFFWGTRFPTGSSEFLDWFITKGFLGGISLLFFLGLIIYLNIRNLIKSENPFGIRLALFASLVSMAGAGFLSSFNFSLWFVFWIVAAGLLFYNSEQIEIDLISQPRRVIFSAVIIAAIVLGLVLFFFQGQKYLAEVNYRQGVEFSRQDKIDQAINSTEKAARLNPSLDVYWRDLAQLYLSRANLIARNPEYAAPEKRQLVQNNVASGVQSLNQAIELAPFNVANWNVRGFFYRSLIGIADAGPIALASYQQAIELEPASPFPYGEIGRVYVLTAQDFHAKQMSEEEKEALENAIENLDKAIELKSDYAPAHYLIAVAYDQLGQQDQAIAKLEEIKKILPQDIGISFQLGMFYWRKEKLPEAEEQFTGIIELNSEHANARYMLGLIYDKKGEKEKAKEQFTKISQLNPDNQEVLKILDNLSNDLPALQGIVPSQPPIQEKPPEIQG